MHANVYIVVSSTIAHMSKGTGNRIVGGLTIANGEARTNSKAEEADLANPSRVRQYFPETWLWFEHTLGYVVMP